MTNRSREFGQSLRPFWIWLGLPALVAAVMLVRLGLWGLWVFPPSQPMMRIAYGYSPLLWAGLICMALAWATLSNAGVRYEITPTLLTRRCGRSQRSLRLDRVYVTRSPGTVLERIRVSNGHVEFGIMRLFMPQFREFAALLEAGSRIRRAEEKL